MSIGTSGCFTSPDLYGSALKGVAGEAGALSNKPFQNIVEVSITWETRGPLRAQQQKIACFLSCQKVGKKQAGIRGVFARSLEVETLNQLEGTLIAGRYEIREHIASGGMASVFKTWDHRVERIVAIKVLRSLDKNDLRAVERFRREARAAAALAHPNAVTIYDFVEEAGQYFLVMEYIQGPTLKQLIAQRRQLHAREAIEVASQVCAVLQVAHARGFIHRDIKPQNIMLALSGGPTGGSLNDGGAWVKLTDFGIVRVAEDAGLTNSGIVLGTADYLSPEQARGETLTASSDLYSLGVVMFEMLTGRPPFVGPTAVSIAMQHASANPPPLRQFNPHVPPAVEQVVNRTLQKEPEDRFMSAAEMQQVLRQCTKELMRGTQPAPGAQAYPRNFVPGADNMGNPPPSARGQY